MKKISDVMNPLTPREMVQWREGYKHYLTAKGLPPDDAADLAAKVAYRADLYPSEIPTRLFPALPMPAATAPTPPATLDTRPARPKRQKRTAATEPASAPEVIPFKPKRTPISLRDERRIEAAVSIAMDRPDGDDMAFTHAILCQVGLPRSRITEREFMRRSGDAWLNVRAGYLDEGSGPVAQPVPYGVMPRLALAWVSTYAKRNSTREIPIGDSAAQFLRMLNIESTGRRYATLRTQMHALAACNLQLGYKGRTFNGQPVEQFDAWLTNPETRQRSLWPGVMVLTEGYYRELVESGVPLDNRALMALKSSALALDVYTWLAHRLHRISGRPPVIHWRNLREQFGQEYTGKDPDKDFKKAFLPALRNVLQVYPQAKVKQVTGGLLLMSSPPPIAPKAQRQIIG